MGNLIDFESLQYPSHDSEVQGHFSYSHNLFFRNDLKDKSLKIDDNLSIISKEKGLKYVSFLLKFLKVKRGINHISGTYFFYRYTANREYYLEAQDRIRMFVMAIRIYKNTLCDTNINFSVQDIRRNKFYKPFDFFEFTSDLFGANGKTYIDSRKEFNAIKKIYEALKMAEIDNTSYYSKLYNAVKFFNHSYDERWNLLKTTLAITSLESLFSDSDKTEITYKIAIRVAYFIYPYASVKRKDVFDFVKYAYNIRSCFVHGSNVEKQLKKIEEKLHKKKGGDYYNFHRHFVNDLNAIVTSCLTKALLDKKSFTFFTNKTPTTQEETDFYDSLVLSS